MGYWQDNVNISLNIIYLHKDFLSNLSFFLRSIKFRSGCISNKKKERKNIFDGQLTGTGIWTGLVRTDLIISSKPCGNLAIYCRLATWFRDHLNLCLEKQNRKRVNGKVNETTRWVSHKWPETRPHHTVPSRSVQRVKFLYQNTNF